MSLPELLTAYANIITDQYINECDLEPPVDPTKYRVLRYHGHAIADDVQCSPDGLLSVWWTSMQPKNTGQCSAFPVVTLNAKLSICWELPKASGGKSPSLSIPYESNDETAARLAWVAECVARRLMGIACSQVNSVDPIDDPLAAIFLQMAEKPVFLDCAPGGAGGGVASVSWRMQVGIFDHAVEGS